MWKHVATFGAGWLAGLITLFVLILTFGDYEATSTALPLAMQSDVAQVAALQVADTPTSEPSPTPIPTETPTDTPLPPTPLPTWTPPPAATPMYYIGDTVIHVGYSLAVLALEDPATQPGIFYEPEPGKRLVAVEFAVGNVSGEMFSSNLLRAELVDANGFLYASDTSIVEGDMELHDVSPGEIVRGWTGFIVPDGIPLARFKYDFGLSDVVIQVGLNRR